MRFHLEHVQSSDARALTPASAHRMTSQSFWDFLAGVGEDYIKFADKLYPDYRTSRELAAADPASLQDFGIHKGAVGVIIKAAKGACPALAFSRAYM